MPNTTLRLGEVVWRGTCRLKVTELEPASVSAAGGVVDAAATNLTVDAARVFDPAASLLNVELMPVAATVPRRVHNRRDAGAVIVGARGRYQHTQSVEIDP